ncbi:Ditrans,polycis-undecaprenyl-diphosphate synthase ((2E,6E)-farnesyl-diphosphate specific) [bacterium HR37]|nr:Ditrans,polycis-undecaprenyl-diphosphate synthase ((2E,6E)-farnesyl-diphosphate specific) [bacterium HR37]
MKGKLQSLLDKEKLPRHIVIIMDGNGRWANRKGLDRISGHREGMKAVRSVVKAARELGIKSVTLYAFSAQNWKRPKEEVNALMELLRQYLIKEGDKLVKEEIRLNAIGRLRELPSDVYKVLIDTMEKTKHCKEMILTLALSYGGREEIVDAVRKILSRGDISPEDINEESFSQFLYTVDLPEPDLLIRTSGEMRLSNFLLWQLAYTEIYVTKTLWPDFRKRHLIKAILNYQNRERRFGLTSDQIKKRHIQ